MKYITPLTEAEQITLENAQKNHEHHRTRIRAHAILLSHKRYTISQLSDIFDAGRDTISIWLNNWENKGIVGLFDESRSGRPPCLTEKEQKQLTVYIDEDPHQLKSAIARLEKETGKKVSAQTYKRVLKKTIIALKDVAAL